MPTRKTLVFPAVELPPSFDRTPRTEIPPPRPSERPTQPTLPGLAASDSSRTDVIELSAGSLVLDDDSARRLPVDAETPRTPPPTRARTLAPLDEAAKRIDKLPRWAHVALAVWGVFSLAAVSGMLVATYAGGPPPVRVPHVATTTREPLEMVRPDPAVTVASGACGVSGPAKVLSTHAQIGAGVDVASNDGAFALGYADGPQAAAGVMLSGTTMKISDRLHVLAPSGVHRVSVETRDDDEDPLVVRVDGTPPITAQNGWITSGKHALWTVPGTQTVGFTRLGSRMRVIAAVPDALRAAPRDDGGVVVAVKKGSTLHVGFADASLEPVAPLSAMPRSGSLCTPAIIGWGGGAVLAWAERPAGARDYDIVVAALAPDGEGEPQIRTIGKGMSPSIAVLRDGGLLVAYASGSSGAHQVVVRRLGRDLSIKGDEQVVSPSAVNAGQPVAAIGADGRGLVAFFVADKRGSGQLLATPVSCQ